VLREITWILASNIKNSDDKYLRLLLLNTTLLEVTERLDKVEGKMMFVSFLGEYN